MNKIVINFSLIIGLLVSAVTVFSADADATAKIRTSLTIVKDSGNTIGITGGNLSFGTIIPNGDGGLVTINPTKSLATCRTATLTTVSSTTYGWASFLVTGSPSASFAITKPAEDTVIIYSAGNVNSMPVNFWKCNDTDLIMALDIDGKASFKIGATLEVGADQPDGFYTGEFNVSVAYN